MNARTLIKTLTVAAALIAPGLALADDGRFGRHDRDRDDHHEYRHVHSSSCSHDATPPPPPRHVRRDSGRYEIQLVNRWVEGRYQDVWVPEQCVYKRNGRIKKCRAGYYDQRWVPGHYVQAQEWVWVSYPAPRPPHHRYGRRAGIEVRVGL